MRGRLVGFALGAAMIVSGLGAYAHAQATAAEQIVLTVAPMRLELTADPGRSITATVTITNSSARALDMTTEANDFVAEDGGEQPRFVPANEVSPWSMSPWVSVEPVAFTLEQAEKREVLVTVAVPPDAEPGGHYAAVLFSGGATDSQGTGIVSKVGALILLTVSGEITQSGTVTLDAPRLLERGPVPMTAAFANDGNVHVKPTGTIIISRWRGQIVSEIPVGGENVLPSSQRSFETSWTDTPDLGVFTARAQMEFGDGQGAESAAVHFVIAPWKSIAAGAGILLLGVVLGLLMRRSKKG